MATPGSRTTSPGGGRQGEGAEEEGEDEEGQELFFFARASAVALPLEREDGRREGGGGLELLAFFLRC